MADPDLDEPARRGGRSAVLWGSSIVLAVAATGVVVLSDDPRLLRLGVVAALWVALLAAFAVVKLRDRASEKAESAAELRRAYERELEREIVARREYEREAEAHARRQATEEKQTEIDQLQAELRQLRENLEQLVGGDLLFERVALRAESTRVRSLPEGPSRPLHNAVIPAPEHRSQQLAVGSVHDGHTDLISPVPTESQGSPRTASRETSRPRPVPNQARYVRPVGQTSSEQSTHIPSRDSRGAREHARGPQARAPQQAASRGPQSPAAQSRAAQQSVARDPREGSQPPVTHVSPVHDEPPARDEPAAHGVSATSGGAVTPDQSGQAVSRGAAGAHTQGTSVNDLLAAYGSSGESRRSRRRRE